LDRGLETSSKCPRTCCDQACNFKACPTISMNDQHSPKPIWLASPRTNLDTRVLQWGCSLWDSLQGTGATCLASPYEPASIFPLGRATCTPRRSSTAFKQLSESIKLRSHLQALCPFSALLPDRSKTACFVSLANLSTACRLRSRCTDWLPLTTFRE